MLVVTLPKIEACTSRNLASNVNNTLGSITTSIESSRESFPILLKGRVVACVKTFIEGVEGFRAHILQRKKRFCAVIQFPLWIICYMCFSQVHVILFVINQLIGSFIEPFHKFEKLLKKKKNFKLINTKGRKMIGL